MVNVALHSPKFALSANCKRLAAFVAAGRGKASIVRSCEWMSKTLQKYFLIFQ
jgi:hypothetical protein